MRKDSGMTDLENRLQNWARWVKPRLVRHSCRSLEHKYKSPQIWHPPEPKTEIDLLDAVEIEKTLTNPTFPKKAYAIIKYAYVEPYIHPMKICRKHGIKNGDIDTELRYAINMLENRLNKKENSAKKLLTAIKDASINEHNNLTLSHM